MSRDRTLALIGHEWRLARRSPGMFAQMALLPLVMMAFFAPLYRDALVAQGYAGASGAEQAVPGMAVLFAFFLIGFVGFGFFQEHRWGTWARLRASAATPSEILVAKCAIPVVLSLVQQSVLFVAGALLLDLRINGSLIALALLALALTACLVAAGVAAAAWLRDEQHLNNLTSLGSMVIGGLGGALAPVALMPGWAQAAAPFTPTYWAVDGYRSVVLDGAGVTAVATPIAVLLLFAAVLAVLGLRRFRFDDVKRLH